ncbi:MAG: hypothetical protein EON59_00535, partial [Alphaproteobacteria bacterium]
MGKKGKSFGSFSDAASALKELMKTKLRGSHTQRGSIEPDVAPAMTGFEDIEAALLRKGQEQVAAARRPGKKLEFNVEMTKKGHATLVEAPPNPLEPTQIRAGLLPKRSAAERPPAPPIAQEVPEPRPIPQPAEPKQKAAPPTRVPLKRRKAKPASPSKAVPAPKPAVPTAPAPPTPRTLLAHIEKIFGERPPAIEPRPQRTLPWVRGGIEEAVTRGAALFKARPEPDPSGYIIGCDFGTSSIKLVVRQPYRAGNPIAARPAPNMLQSARHPYLWQSVLWFDPATGRFSLWPGKGIALEGFKAGILAGKGGTRVLPNLPVTRNEAAAAFLALQLAHCLGWYDKERPLGSEGAGHYLAVNIGIPVAASDDGQIYRDFRHIVSAAHCLIPHAGALSHELVRQCYQASSHDLPEGFDLIPELTAAITGYANEPYARNGAHILIDVGASTLDIVAFNLVGRERVSAFAAEVGLLGAAALQASMQEKFDDALFQKAMFDQYDRVFDYAQHPNVAQGNFNRTLRKHDVQLIAIGGGSKTEVHKDAIKRIDGTLGDLKLVNPAPPSHLTDKKCDTSRLLLAYGLTSDIPEQLELRRPSQIPK